MKMFGTVFFALCMFFLAWILLAGTPLERITRTCQPASWIGRAMTTAASLAGESAEAKVKASTDEMFQTCRYFVFRQFYAEELKAQMAAAEAARQAAGGAGAAAGVSK